jgi:hypothetical protein
MRTPSDTSLKEDMGSLPKAGFTAIELLVFIANVTIGFVIAVWAGRKFGWPGAVIGFICGFLFLVAAFYIIILVCDLIWWGRPWAPPCRSGKCHAADYKSQKDADGNWSIIVCRCGGRYRKKGGQFFELQPDGSESRYMIWRAFRGWFPDNK